MGRAKTASGLWRAFSPAFFGLVLFIPWRVGAEESGAAKYGFGGAMLLDRLGPPERCSGCWPHDGEVAGGGVADFGLVISGAALTLFLTLTRARALMARQWSARCYGVARQREGSRQNSIGGSGVLSLRHFSGWFSLSLGAWVPNNLARRRMVSAGAMLLDRLGPAGFRFTDFRAPR